jgi:hypothetical protein
MSNDLLNFDSCNIYNYISKLEGLPSNSISPTDTMIY